jgi:KaiC/GvpD/RAD55 family RecA-like ATPase
MTPKSEISSVNAHVQEYLDYYCGLTNPPGFAVLLKGSWGSGKTWFIEQYQKSLETKNLRTLYISLYGMKSTSDATSQKVLLAHEL